MNRYKKYYDLLSMNYEEAVDYLLQKYGPAQDDYFRESSYQRFMKGEIKNITKGKTSRAKEGLYCHHIDEIKWLKISDQNFVKEFNIPFEYQTKDRLVYCDLVEHTVLHVLITKETSFEFGYPGYSAYLKGLIEEWYLEGVIPKPEWMKRCYDQSFLEPRQAFKLMKTMQEMLGQNYYNSLEGYYESQKKDDEKLNKRKEQRKQIRLDDKRHWIERAKQLDHQSSRNDIITASYYVCIYYKNIDDILRRTATFEEYNNEMKQYTKQQILDELLVYIDNVSEEESDK
ncbi:MAG TPA: hypothetical protein VK135_02640 [Candidatus Dormibacteraeota bacterium]|nr:hypothetical protein [Candidatus Dormibacteraeota bacterium]